MFLLKGLNSEKHAKKKQTNKNYIPTSLSWLMQYSLPWRFFTIKTLLKEILSGTSVVFFVCFGSFLFWFFNFTKKIRDNRKRLNLFPQQWEFTASRISSRQGYGVRVTFTRTSNTVSHSPPSFPWTTGFCGIRLGSYALIPLPKFHLYNPLKQGWSTNSYSQVLWLNFASSSNPCLLPDPGCCVYHSGLRFLGSYACAELPLGTATSFLHCEEPGYSKAPSTTTCKDDTQSGKKKINIKSITGNSGLMISVHC